MKTHKIKTSIWQLYLPALCLAVLVSGAVCFSYKTQQQQATLQNALQQLRTIDFILLQQQQLVNSQQASFISVIYACGFMLESESLEELASSEEKAAALFNKQSNKLKELALEEAGPAEARKEEELSAGPQLAQGLKVLLQNNNDLLELASRQSARKSRHANISWLVCFLSLTALLVLVFRFCRFQIGQAIKSIEAQTSALIKGTDLPAGQSSSVLFGTIQQNLQQHSLQQKKLSLLAEQIGEGNFSQQAGELEGAGALGKAVGLMREKVQRAFRDEEKRSWSSEGLARFSETIRDNSHNQDILCSTVLNSLVPFIHANQGSIFIKEEKEDILNLSASYAWGRKKYNNKQYYIGEGLIGQAAQEKDTIILTDVPNDFISIGSGLGHANPKCIVILPLVAGEELYGILELASFTNFDEYQINFLQKLCEILASAIAVARVNGQTAKLLQEAEEANHQLRTQEEMLRQNTEEMMATQEAMVRKEEELSGLFASLNYSQLTAEIDETGSFTKLNELFTGALQKSEEECLGQPFSTLIEIQGWSGADYHSFLRQLQEGTPRNLECRLKASAKRWISASFTPVKTKEGNLLKIMMLAHDISEKKEAEEVFMVQAEEIKEQEEQLRLYTCELEKLQEDLEDRLEEARKGMEQQIKEIKEEKIKNEAILEGCVDGVVSFNEKGIIEYFNRAAEDIWEIARMEVLGRNIRDFIPVEILKEEEGLMVYYAKNGERKVLDARTEVPVKNRAGHEMEVLLTLTRVEVEGIFTFTAFAQKVAVELF